jgi:hypothetical protein
MRLIGERPQSISGCTLSITTDGNARAMRHQSTEIQQSERINPIVRRWRGDLARDRAAFSSKA